jgi:hypothetical protein
LKGIAKVHEELREDVCDVLIKFIAPVKDLEEAVGFLSFFLQGRRKTVEALKAKDQGLQNFMPH